MDPIAPSDDTKQKSPKHTAFRKQFAEHLNLALDRYATIPAGYGRVISVAELFGVSQNTAANWLKGDGVPELARLPEIAEILGTTVEQLIFGDVVPRTHAIDKYYVKVDLRLAGSDAEPAWYALPETLTSIGLPCDIKMLQVGDDDMAPYIGRGNLVIYDRSVNEIHTNGVFVLQVDGRCFVRRVQRSVKHQMRLICDNPLLADEVLDVSDFAVGDRELTTEDASARIVVLGEVLGRLAIDRR